MSDYELLQRTAKVLQRHEEDRPRSDGLAVLKTTRLNLTGHNIKYRGDGGGHSWFIKFCKDHEKKREDICEREVLVSLFGQVLGIPIVKAWMVSADSIAAVQTLPDDPTLIRHKCVVMEWLEGPTLMNDLDAATKTVRSNTGCIANLLAFMHWIGDEDRGLNDVILDEGQLVLIDNGLCGPGGDDVLRGAHPDCGVFWGNRVALLTKCYPHKGSFVEFVLSHVAISTSSLQRATVIDNIQNLPTDAIRRIVDATGLERWVADELIARQLRLRNDYLDWLSQAAQVCSEK
jgi:hypothetical protein